MQDAVSTLLAVAAAPASLLDDGRLPSHRLTVTSGYPRLTAEWIRSASLDAQVVRSFGATEVFPHC
jgi:ATP phosphoribosyltransferase